MTLSKGTQHTHQMLDIIVTARHQMPTAHIEPLELRQEATEILLDDFQRLLQIFRRPLAEGMEVEAFNTRRELLQL